MKREDLSALLRKMGLIYYADLCRYRYRRLQNRARNRAFLRTHPEVALPPDYLLYESFGLDYRKYYYDGLETARWLVGLLGRHVRLREANMLDWGCGPARIVRHLPRLLDPDCHCFGTDYNRQTVEWCKNNIPQVRFSHNGLHPPLPYLDHFFDAVYGISIFTHLSEAAHHAWLQELLRVAGPAAVLLFTTHGGAFRSRLTRAEQRHFDEGKLVVREKVKEGHRMFGAFHPPAFVESFFNQYATILEHIPGRAPGKETGSKPEQDVWILRKK